MKNKISKIKGCFLIISCFFCSTGLTEVTLDGSLGTAGALNGPDFQITENLGSRSGNNLFHSFGDFSLDHTETATFSGTAGIANIIGRVTGGQASSIDGALRVTIPDADLFLLNPAGIIFGEHAKLDVPGSFHASTANFMKFQDGVQFDSGSAVANPILTTATPQAFGFLDGNSASISLTGGNKASLTVANGKTLSLIGGDIVIKDSSLFAPGGQINLVSAASAGEAEITELGLNTASFAELGDIDISQNPIIERANAGQSFTLGNVDVTADAAGKVFIRGGQLIMDNAKITMHTIDDDGGDLTMKASSIKVTNGSVISSISFGEGQAGDVIISDADYFEISNGAFINTSIIKSGGGGDLSIEADAIVLAGEGNTVASGIISLVFGEGSTGDLTITAADKIDILSGALIFVANAGSGNSGDLTINANNASILLSDQGRGSTLSTGIHAQATGKGTPANVKIHSGRLQIRDGATISALISSSANNDRVIDINSPLVILSGNGSSIISETRNIDNIEDIDETILNIDKAGLNTSNAATIKLTATDRLELQDGAFISSSTVTKGNSGDLIINAGSLVVRDNATISASTFAAGQAGNLEIEADNILLYNAELQSESFVNNIDIDKDSKIAMSGNVNLKVHNQLHLQNKAYISVMTNKANAGGISIEGEGFLKLSDGSEIITSAVDGQGMGGDIFIASPFVVLDGSAIKAKAFEGMAGNITISDFLFKSPYSDVNASSKLSMDGEIRLKPDTNISGSITALPDTLMDASINMSERCASRTGSHMSSLAVKESAGLSARPGDLASSNYSDYILDESSSAKKMLGLANNSRQPEMNEDCTE